MANLSNLLGNKRLAQIEETNLAQGEVFIFTANGNRDATCDFCWRAPAAGTVTVEAWGAAGSSSMMCCCGLGLPGNTGGYFQTVQVQLEEGQFICGCAGHSCGNASSLCFRGCSNPTMVCIQDTGCACAQGGRSGFTRCVEGQSTYCCFTACGFCGTRIGSNGCGVICNYSPSYAFEADTFTSGISLAKCYPGQTSCMFMLRCASGQCWRYHKPVVPIPPGIFTTEPSFVSYWMDCCCYNAAQAWSGFKNALGALSTSRTNITPWDFCWTSSTYCGCYEAQGCIPMIAPGIPAPGTSPCSGVRDHGQRGGHGAIKIKFERN